MKKKYKGMELEIIRLNTGDMILTSGPCSCDTEDCTNDAPSGKGGGGSSQTGEIP